MNQGITSKYFSGTNTFFARLAEGIIRWRWLLLILISVLTVSAFYEMRTIQEQLQIAISTLAEKIFLFQLFLKNI